LTETRFHTSLH